MLRLQLAPAHGEVSDGTDLKSRSKATARRKDAGVSNS